MKKYLSISIILSLISSAHLFAQVTQQWVARYDGPSNSADIPSSIAIDGLGNIYMTGRSLGANTSDDYATVKYNPAGAQLWVSRYNGPPGNNIDAATSIAVDASGNVYVTGFSYGINTNYDYATIKYNSSGVQQWVQRYNGPGNNNDEAKSLAVDGAGNVYVTGYTFNSVTGNDIATIKYNSSGVQQWIQIYNGPGNGDDHANSLYVDAYGNVYITGGSKNAGPYLDYVTIKYNTNGVQQWIQIYNGQGNGDDDANFVTVDIAGNVYVTGESDGIGTNYDFATVKYNSSGVQQWVGRYTSPGYYEDEGESLCVDNSGNVYVTGGTSVDSLNVDFATIKYNSSGVQQWIQLYNTPSNGFNLAHSIAIDTLGGIYVTGESYGGSTKSDFATVKYNTNGVQQWVQRYNGSANNNDISYAIAVDKSGNVYLTGGSEGFGTDYDYVTIKYSQPIGIKPISTEIPKQFSLEQNYPNPFNLSTNIKFQIAKFSDSKLIIYNAVGQEISTLVNESLKPGNYGVTWDASNYPSGVYFYKLYTESFSQTRKLVLLK